MLQRCGPENCLIPGGRATSTSLHCVPKVENVVAMDGLYFLEISFVLSWVRLLCPGCIEDKGLYSMMLVIRLLTYLIISFFCEQLAGC